MKHLWIVLLLLIIPGTVWASIAEDYSQAISRVEILTMELSAENYDDEKLCRAIFQAEGGHRAQYLYGIRSVPYSDVLDARQICLNTIRNNKKRFMRQAEYDDYLEFLASRYCPIGAENDPTGLNQHWIKNVQYFYERGA